MIYLFCRNFFSIFIQPKLNVPFYIKYNYVKSEMRKISHNLPYSYILKLLSPEDGEGLYHENGLIDEEGLNSVQPLQHINRRC
jgi:hypothetical protein